jgi:sodium pump decarboxylase gamma subunit
MSDLTFGLWLTVVGMGVVFGLLALLWAMLAIVGRLDRREEGGSAADVVEAAPEAREMPLLTDEELAAVTVAVAAHREARRRQAAPETRSAIPGSHLWASRWLAAGRTRQTRGWQGRR